MSTRRIDDLQVTNSLTVAGTMTIPEIWFYDGEPPAPGEGVPKYTVNVNTGVIYDDAVAIFTPPAKSAVYFGTSAPDPGTGVDDDLWYLKNASGVITQIYKKESGTWNSKATVGQSLVIDINQAGSSVDKLAELNSITAESVILTADYTNDTGRTLTGVCRINWGMVWATNLLTGANSLTLRCVYRSWDTAGATPSSSTNALAQELYITNVTGTTISNYSERLSSQDIAMSIDDGVTWRIEVRIRSVSSTLSTYMSTLQFDGPQATYILK